MIAVTVTDQIHVRTARANEAAAISALAIRSKGYWGYSDEFLDAVRDELTYTEQDCDSGRIVVAQIGGDLAGFYAISGTPPRGELTSLFVDLPWIGSGVGRTLLQHALDSAAAQGFETLTLDADPGAESFYAKFGARRIASSPSGSVPGRTLPRLEFALVRR